MADFESRFIFCLLFCGFFNPEESIRINRDFSYPKTEEFKVYWNVPTFQCHKHGINFKPHTEKYGIISNPKDAFRGKEINILYDPGLFPAVLKNQKGILTDRNGGIPQLGNVTVHLEAFRKVVEEVVPKDLTGLAIIDFETWRPVFRQNWRDQVIYKNMSKEFERKKHPYWPEKTVTAMARENFEKHSREFMQKTLKLARHLRPKASWGYYGFPYCYNFRCKKRPQCPDIAMRENDEILWLFDSSTGLFPSIYMSSKLSPSERVQFVIGRLNEAWRMAAQTSKRNFPHVYPYIWFKYYDSNDFLSKEDTYTALEITRRYKMGGAVIWGSSSNVNTKEKCKDLLHYLDSVLGPALIESRRNQNEVDSTDSAFGFIRWPFFSLSESADENGRNATRESLKPDNERRYSHSGSRTRRFDKVFSF